MSLVNTRIQNLRANSNIDKYETRPSQYGGLDLFMSQDMEAGGIITPELRERAFGSIGSDLETPVIDYDGGISIGTTRSSVIADSENSSNMLQINFATYSWGFTQVPSLFHNNEISQQKDFETKFLKYLYKFAETLDGVAVAALTADRSQVFAETLNYSVVGNAVQAPYAERQTIIGDMNPIMSANDYFGQIHVLGNYAAQSIIRNLSEHGLQNDQNRQLQYSDKILHFSNRVTNGVGEYANMFAVNAASLGVLTRVDRESLYGRMMRNGTEWGVSTLPMLGLPVGTYWYESNGDYSAIAGAASADMTNVYKEHYGFSVDVAFITPYNSDPATIASPIGKFTVLSA